MLLPPGTLPDMPLHAVLPPPAGMRVRRGQLTPLRVPEHAPAAVAALQVRAAAAAGARLLLPPASSCFLPQHTRMQRSYAAPAAPPFKSNMHSWPA